MNFLIAYDIAEPRRLRRVARLLEKHALRCQKSVFLYRGELNDVVALLEELTPMLDLQEDAVQSWLLSQVQPSPTLVRGQPVPVMSSAVVLADRQQHFVCRQPK